MNEDRLKICAEVLEFARKNLINYQGKSKKWYKRRNKKYFKLIYEVLLEDIFIPYGDYCYKLVEHIQPKDGSFPYWITKPCTFYYINKLGYGDCGLIKECNGKKDYFDICLDDRCKCCNINVGDDEYF